MFDGIAGVYDLLNTAMTAGLHHRWRARAPISHACAQAPRARRGDRHGRSGDRARRARGAGRRGGRQRLRRGDAGARARQGRRAPWPRACARASSGPTRWRCHTTDDAFDAATVGFGARNFSDLHRGLAEMVRVVRPGGRVVVLEITTPTRPPLSIFYGVWFDRIVPVLGRATQWLGRRLVAAAALWRRSGERARGDDRRRLCLPAELGQALPGAGAAGGGARARGTGGDRLRAAGRRDRGDPRRHGARGAA